MVRLLVLCLCVSIAGADSSTTARRPNIIIMLADDLGWNDVSFHGSNQIPTPNIDALAYNGIILNSHYVPALCTPSRAALLTGKHPVHTGMHHKVILAPEPWGLPLKEKILPEYLKEAGYVTRALGKWHLGFSKKEYTPTHRGFDSHYGYWNGYHDYYDHTMMATFKPYRGYDMRRNMSIDWEAAGKYSTDLFTDEAVRIIEDHDTSRPLFLYFAHLAPHAGNDDQPFQAPRETIDRFRHIKDPERRTYAAMVSKMDDSVGEVMQALKERDMLENSIVIFMSDNGAVTHGIHYNKGSNFPLKGMKESPWEGGVRGVAAVWSPRLKRTQRVSNQLMHIMDWVPTLYSAAGLDVKRLGDIDGVDMWDALSYNNPSPRTELLHNIDDIDQYASVRRGDWKYVTGTVLNGKADGWFGESGREVGDQDYDSQVILSSKSSTAIQNITALVTEEDILRIKNESEIVCEPKPLNAPLCKPRESPCLFNIRDDPCEYHNLADSRPVVLHSLQQSLASFRATVLPMANKPDDIMSNPAYWNDTWVNWEDYPGTKAILPYPFTSVAVFMSMATLTVLAVTLLVVKQFQVRKHLHVQ